MKWFLSIGFSLDILKPIINIYSSFKFFILILKNINFNEVISISAKYNIEIEISESDGLCQQHKVGEKFKYPEEKGKICHWLLDSMTCMIRVLQYGGTLPWTYSDTPYEKKIDPNGITTEFVRCPDPTSTVIAKITRIPNPT